MINGVCVPVNDQCSTFDENTGDCLSCYLGYNLEGGKCIIQDLTLVVPADKGGPKSVPVPKPSLVASSYDDIRYV